jgi:hypothetical protein
MGVAEPGSEVVLVEHLEHGSDGRSSTFRFVATTVLPAIPERHADDDAEAERLEGDVDAAAFGELGTLGGGEAATRQRERSVSGTEIETRRVVAASSSDDVDARGGKRRGRRWTLQGEKRREGNAVQGMKQKQAVHNTVRVRVQFNSRPTHRKAAARERHCPTELRKPSAVAR